LEKANADAAAASASMAAFVTNAVKEAKAHGLEFTEAEAHAFMADQAAAAARGELSDTQLEAVAGGNLKSKENKQGLDALWSIMAGYTDTINIARNNRERSASTKWK
jgi:hypothetical protein